MAKVKVGYRQSEVGIIPEDWDVVAAAEACDLVVDCKNRTPPVVEASDYAVVRTPNVRNGQFVRVDLRYTDKHSYLEWTARAVPQFGDIMITREAPLGEVCPVPAEPKVCLGQRMMLYRPSRKKTNSRYLLYSLMSLPVRSNLLRKIGGSTVGHAKVDDIRLLQLPLPSLPEQCAIAEALSDADLLLDALDQLIVKKRALKQAAMQQLLTGQTRLPGFADKWESKCVGEIFRISTASSKTGFVVENGDFWVCDMGSVSVDGDLIVSKRTNYSADFLRAGDLIMPKDDIGGGNIIGKVGYINQNETYILGDHVYRLRVVKGNPRFLAYAINSHLINSELRRKVIGSAQLGLGRTSVVEQAIVFPPLAEQTAIAAVLLDMSAELSTLEARRAKTAALKQGMMQELLTGRTRLV
jgi:type I restriction enzyme S subunit